jgi:hypothetical protein
MNGFPDYLKKNVVEDTVLKVYANGMANYKLFGVNIKVTAKWDYKAVEGSDTHFAVFHGTKADLLIKQTVAEKYAPVLYILPVKNDAAYEKAINAQLKIVQAKYPGVELKKEGKGYTVIIPEKYKDGHEAHFGRVTETYLGYLRNSNMPKWEIPNMIAKYYTTTSALELAKKSK